MLVVMLAGVVGMSSSTRYAQAGGLCRGPTQLVLCVCLTQVHKADDPDVTMQVQAVYTCTHINCHAQCVETATAAMALCRGSLRVIVSQLPHPAPRTR